MTQCAIPPQIDQISWPIISLAALADSVNPCAIAVLLILLAGLLAAGKTRRVLWSGLFFALGLYLTYLLAGFGILSALGLLSYAKIFHIIVGVFALTMGAYYLKVAFFPPEGGEICIGGICSPNSKPARIVRKVTSPPTAFIAGALITIVELPCTGGPYLFTLGYLSRLPKLQVLPWLLYYNVLFILPLLILIFLVYFGISSIEKTARWKHRWAKTLNIIAGVLMTGLGVWVLTS